LVDANAEADLCWRDIDQLRSSSYFLLLLLLLLLLLPQVRDVISLA